jgi:hypothetical protein
MTALLIAGGITLVVQARQTTRQLRRTDASIDRLEG